MTSTYDVTAHAQDQTRHTSPPPTGRTRRSWAAVIALGVALATTINVLILAIARAAGASMAYVDAGSATQVGAADVIISSAVPLTVGTVLAVLLALRWPWMIRVGQVVGALAGLVTLAGPMSLETDSSTQVALAAMHLVIVAVVLAIFEAGRRRTIGGVSGGSGPASGSLSP